MRELLLLAERSTRHLQNEGAELSSPYNHLWPSEPGTSVMTSSSCSIRPRASATASPSSTSSIAPAAIDGTPAGTDWPCDFNLAGSSPALGHQLTRGALALAPELVAAARDSREVSVRDEVENEAIQENEAIRDEGENEAICERGAGGLRQPAHSRFLAQPSKQTPSTEQSEPQQPTRQAAC
ncbi:unnamed protein product [Phytophthora lilii]|uniref:Unnamed protein product n=1 Tax=Phytophthora lilii TaxID=2077276 RepID=A0A9W6U644_9STRA|nr:unnamed protein product [Phytophthora lilii]